MMKRLPAFLLFFLFLHANVHAQSDFRSGYIITQNNDTIHGYIDYKVNARNIEECRFKTGMDTKPVSYTPDDIRAYRYDNANFFVAMPVSGEDVSVEKNHFVEQLIDGISDVFFYVDHQGGHFLIRKENGNLYELKNTRTQIEVEGKTYTKFQKEYIGVLKYLYQDSPATIQKVNNLDLDQNSLIDIAELYHNNVCDEYECLVYAKTKYYPEFTFGLFTGHTISEISFRGNEYIKELNSTFSRGNSFTFGVFLNVQDPLISERLSLQIEASHLQANYSTDSTRINIGYLKVPLILKYTYPSERVKPSFQLGLTYNRWRSFDDEGIVPEVQERDAIQKKRYQYGLLSGVELSYPITQKNSIFVQGRYEYCFGKHWNQWVLRDGFGSRIPFGESVESKTNFLSLTAGITF